MNFTKPTRFAITTLATLATLASFASFAEGSKDRTARDEVRSSTTSRAEVRAELQRTRSAGQSSYIDNSYPGKQAQTAAAKQTRADVRAELERIKRASPTQTSDNAYPGRENVSSVQPKAMAIKVAAD